MSQPVPQLPAPYYIYAPQRLDDGYVHTAQLHMLCHQLNAAGYPAYLVDALVTHGGWWTPFLTPATIAGHHIAGLTPITLQISRRNDRDLPGLQAHFAPTEATTKDSDLCCTVSLPGSAAPLQVALPWFDTCLLDYPCAPESTRTTTLVYSGHMPAGHFKLRPEHQHLRDISPFSAHPIGTRERWEQLAQAKTLYAYAEGSVVTEAQLLGCQVIFVANDHQLQSLPQQPLGTWGTYLNTLENPLDSRPYTTAALRQALSALSQAAPAQLQSFIGATQAAAASLSPQQAWSAEQLRAIESWLPTSPEGRAARSDEIAVNKMSRDYAIWTDKATPTEIYSDICAELVFSGQMASPTVHLFAHGRSTEALADAMDELGKSWLPAKKLVIHADIPAPGGLDESIAWFGPDDTFSPQVNTDDEWVILMEAGTRLEPYTLIELLMRPRSHQHIHLVHGAYDLPLGPSASLPLFAGGANIAMLRGTNYLGGIVAVRAATWATTPGCGRYASAYRMALRCCTQWGTASLHYVDKLLSHAPAQLADGQENEEFTAAQAELLHSHPTANLQVCDVLGCWRPRYPDCHSAVTLIVPTGKQQGYLRSFLLSGLRYNPGEMEEALLIVQDEDMASMEQFVQHWPHTATLPLRLIASGDGPYNHSRSINLGLKAARTDFVLVCDDDLEWVDSGSISELRSHFAEDKVAISAPRLVLQQGAQPLLVAGPQLPGADGKLLNYTGDSQGLAERGYLNRLQMPQDVAGVHGACWMARRDALLQIGGLDETNTPFIQSVTDVGYRLQQQGWRLIWTPHASAMHLGSITVKAVQRDPAQALKLSQANIAENSYLRQQWLSFAAAHPYYSKHFSASRPYALDTDMVNTWSPDIQMRPRVLAMPIRSGSGQYRVIEPLDAVQLRSLAETCVVEPEKPGQAMRRILTPTDIARFRPNRILMQHSTSDGDISNLRSVRQSLPQAFIVQLMDDLTSDLPASHPSHVHGQREGHTRTLQALELSNRLVVSTQPLADYYRPYCEDIRIVPNSLDMRHWGQYYQPASPTPRPRPRIGWAGAAQHLGDLRLVQHVVRRLADQVDWVFMGMCPDELRPYVKEFHQFVSYKDYPAKLASLDLDIAIAPLENNPFNACKSNLRLLEYGAMGWPVVCSDVYPFQTENPPVFRVSNDEEDWLNALNRLIQDPELRRTQGEALHAWLLRHYTIEAHADNWFHAIFD